MDVKKLFKKDNKALSPVIGVILMVAITVVLAAAIGSFVAGQEPPKTAPKANLDIIPSTEGSIKIKHLGGDTINFNETTFKVYIDGKSVNLTTNPSGSFSTGDTMTLAVPGAKSGNTVEVKILDEAPSQFICDKTVRL